MTTEALTGGYRLSFVVAAGILVAAIGVASTVLRSESRAAAEAEALAGGGQAGDPAYSEAV